MLRQRHVSTGDLVTLKIHANEHPPFATSTRPIGPSASFANSSAKTIHSTVPFLDHLRGPGNFLSNGIRSTLLRDKTEGECKQIIHIPPNIEG